MNQHETEMPHEADDCHCDAADHWAFHSHSRFHFEFARDYAIRDCREPGIWSMKWEEESFHSKPKICTHPYLNGTLLLGISLLRSFESTSLGLQGTPKREFTTSVGDHPPLTLPPRKNSESLDELLHRANDHLNLHLVDVEVEVDEAEIYLMALFIEIIEAAFRHRGRFLRQLRDENYVHEGTEVGPYLNATLLLAEMMTTFEGFPDTSEEVLEGLEYPEAAINISEAVCSTIKMQCSIREFLDSLERNLVIRHKEMKYSTWTVDCADSRYVQFLVKPNGVVIVEVISNLHGVDWALSSDDEDELRAMGFHEPAYGPFPNWWQEYPARDNHQELIVKIARVMFVIFKEQPSDSVQFRLGSFKLAKGQSLEDYLLEKRAYSLHLSDPSEISRMLQELDDPETRSNWLSDE